MGAYKGISDVIAVVLMIAIAVSIGVFVTTFATKWVQDQTSDPSIACALKTNYVVDDVKYNFSGKGELLVKITSKGEEGIYGFGFIFDNITKIISFNSTDPLVKNHVQSTSPLTREQSTLVTLNLSNVSRGYPVLINTLKKLTVTNDACKAVSASTTSVTEY